MDTAEGFPFKVQVAELPPGTIAMVISPPTAHELHRPGFLREGETIAEALVRHRRAVAIRA